MGTLVYDSTGNGIEIEDRTLAHLRIVIMNKFRRGEPFMFDVLLTDGSAGKRSLWMHPNIPVTFRFNGSRRPSINRAWIERLMVAANSPNGLWLVPEPDEAATRAFEVQARSMTG